MLSLVLLGLSVCHCESHGEAATHTCCAATPASGPSLRACAEGCESSPGTEWAADAEGTTRQVSPVAGFVPATFAAPAAAVLTRPTLDPGGPVFLPASPPAVLRI